MEAVVVEAAVVEAAVVKAAVVKKVCLEDTQCLKEAYVASPVCLVCSYSFREDQDPIESFEGVALNFGMVVVLLLKWVEVVHFAVIHFASGDMVAQALENLEEHPRTCFACSLLTDSHSLGVCLLVVAAAWEEEVKQFLKMHYFQTFHFEEFGVACEEENLHLSREESD